MCIRDSICRGNYHSAYFSSGAYDSVAEPLFGRENVDAYYLEFDDERSGGFDVGPLHLHAFHEPGAAVDLQGVVGDLQGDVGGVHLGHGEIVVITDKNCVTLKQPGNDMKICTFLWVCLLYTSRCV